jgi:hypothetical protein
LEKTSSWRRDGGGRLETGEVGMYPDPLWMLLGCFVDPVDEMRSIVRRVRPCEGKKGERVKVLVVV